MKTKDIKALHDKTVADLETELTKYNFDLANMRLKKKVGKLDSVAKLKNLSDDIARIKTVLTEKNNQKL